MALEAGGLSQGVLGRGQENLSHQRGQEEYYPLEQVVFSPSVPIDDQGSPKSYKTQQCLPLPCRYSLACPSACL